MTLSQRAKNEKCPQNINKLEKLLKKSKITITKQNKQKNQWGLASVGLCFALFTINSGPSEGKKKPQKKTLKKF